MKRKLLVLGLMVCLVVSLSGEALAANHSGAVKKSKSNAVKVQNIKKIRSSNLLDKKFGYSAMDSSGTIFINAPEKNAVYYQGEKIKYDFTAWDNWVYVWAGPTARFINVSTQVRYLEQDFEVVAEKQYDDYDGVINTKKVPAGNYEFSVILYPYEYANDAEPVDDYMDWDLPEAHLYMTLKTLKAPAGVKAVAGKKRVTVTYKAAKGASKYEIYRSLKKNSGFKRVKVTSARKFVDKKVKKGKRYYYKVKTVRTEHNTIKSGFSAVKRSGKVKR